MVAMFGVGAGAFFKDYKWGYPEKNIQRFYFLAFEKAKESFSEHLKAGGTPAEWEAKASQERVFVPIETPGEVVEEPGAVIPRTADLATPWPNVLTSFQKYSEAYEADKLSVIPPAWKEYSNSGGRAWDEKPKEVKTRKKIDEQLYIGIFCTILFLIALFILLRTRSRSMKVDSQGYTPPGGKLIPYGSIKRIDARKWDTKGLATLTYEEGGKEKKAKVDGMIYGQFKKEDGEPAQRLYEQILANFQGELIELAAENDEEGEETPTEVSTNDSE